MKSLTLWKLSEESLSTGTKMHWHLRCCADGSGTQKPGWSLQNRHWFRKQYLGVFYFPTCFYSNGITNNDFLFTIPLIRRNKCQQKMIESKS